MTEVIKSLAVPALAAAVVIILMLMTIMGLSARRRGRSLPPFQLKPDLETCETIDTAVARLLREMVTWVDGLSYHAYWLEEEGAIRRLRASMSQPSNPIVAPNYSGLVNEETTLVAIALPVKEDGSTPSIVSEGKVRWLEVPFGRHLLLRVELRPESEISPELLQQLAAAGQAFTPLTIAISNWFRAREATERSDSLMDSSGLALDTTLRPDKAMELLLRVGGFAVEARVQCAVITAGGVSRVLSDTPLGHELGERVRKGEVRSLLSVPAAPDVTPGHSLGPLGVGHSACVRAPVRVGKAPLGCIYYFTEHVPSLNAYQSAVLQALGERIAHLLESERQMAAAADGYTTTLRAIVEAYDGLSPYSLGHSDRLARYARLTALELNFSEAEAEAIALAAYFHDVGMVAVDPKIVLKPGRVRADEMERIKVHAELGGQMVRPLLAALPLDPMVASHHERYDGHGYPRGLKGEAIPLGARIIAVADLFDAKTTGRSYRDPVRFIEAIDDLNRAAGSALDPGVVEAFVRAWSRVPQMEGAGVPPFRCWELKQLSKLVCAGCPNRSQQPVRCWENRENLCTRHGDKCETCLVYTLGIGGEVQAPSSPTSMSTKG